MINSLPAGQQQQWPLAGAPGPDQREVCGAILRSSQFGRQTADLSSSRFFCSAAFPSFWFCRLRCVQKIRTEIITHIFLETSPSTFLEEVLFRCC